MGISSRVKNRHYLVTAAASFTLLFLNTKNIWHEFRFTNAVFTAIGNAEWKRSAMYPYRQPCIGQSHFRRTALSSRPPWKIWTRGSWSFRASNNAGCRGADRTVRQGDPALPAIDGLQYTLAQRRKHGALRPRGLATPLTISNSRTRHLGSIRVCRGAFRRQGNTLAGESAVRAGLSPAQRTELQAGRGTGIT